MAETRIFPDKNLVSTSSLENLPKELHSLIFQALPDCASLQALVQASPSYHASYISQRQHILSRVLLNELGLDGLYLAFALEQVCILPWLQRDYEEQLHLFHQSFFGHFFKRFLDSATTDWTPDTDLDTLTWICRRHWLIRSVALEYIADKIKVNPLTGNVVRNGQPATAEECRRKYRALYHFEIYRCLFVSYTLTGDTEDAYYYQQRVQLGGWEYGTSMRYLPNIDVCDAEGVACVRKFLSSQYMKRMTTDCREELQRLEDHPPDWNPISKGIYGF
ncbi:uncharacterized protein LY89DRAFT_148688 [Mollisia scopiformis]|uniref:F-box domain-containing protein n=1 Tax=Mollisia scopiformis TaxID=149040 RepID=A0A194X1X5_MOLSC|nr:uncharacterized protein LY89DRAFT_148688 [Mollisia scopiformis]KUJ13842.1 hypothetical protein LY89DRAFT_148688 [Mollisia scopiformis]